MDQKPDATVLQLRIGPCDATPAEFGATRLRLARE